MLADAELGAQRLPWRGRAGQTLRRWFEMDEDEFYGTFYCASVTRCYPGRAPSGRGDRTPTPREQELCSFWRDRELKILRPPLIVPVGGLAIRRLLGVTGLADCIGRRFELTEFSEVEPVPPKGTRRKKNLAAKLLKYAIDWICGEPYFCRARSSGQVSVVSCQFRQKQYQPAVCPDC